MKKSFLISSTILALAFLSSCDLFKDLVEGEDEEELRREFLISRTWIPTKVVNEGVDITTEFQDFELNFSTAFITTRNGGLAFPDEVGWQFGLNENTIERDDDVTMDITKINEGSRTYTVKFTVKDPDARANGIYGHYEFSFESD